MKRQGTRTEGLCLCMAAIRGRSSFSTSPYIPPLSACPSSGIHLFPDEFLSLEAHGTSRPELSGSVGEKEEEEDRALAEKNDR